MAGIVDNLNINVTCENVHFLLDIFNVIVKIWSYDNYLKGVSVI